MKIVIFGASGKTGKLVALEALEAGHKVIAYVRNPASLEFEHENLKIVVGNLSETLKMRDAISGADACISTLGGSSLTKHSFEIIQGIDNIINCMELENAPRFIYLSSLGAGESKYFMPQPIRFIIVNLLLRVPLKDHQINEQRIVRSKLKWTVIRPGGLTDNAKTTDLKYGSEAVVLKGSSSISRASVAFFINQQLSDSQFINKNVWLHE